MTPPVHDPSQELPQPSAWVMRFAPLLAPGASVLDLACGSGRHVRALAARGHAMHAVDRDAQALEPLRGIAKILVTDLETGPWPFGTQTFGGVVVTNYLWRPLLPHIVRAVATAGVLIYETFALGNETVGKPRNPDFLLRPGELLDAARPALRVVAYEDGFVQTPKPAYVQRICAVRERMPAQAPVASAESPPAKYNL